MPDRVVENKAGMDALLRDVGDGMAGFADLVAARIKPLAPFGSGIHLPRSRKRIIFTHYRDSIQSATYVNGQLHAGHAVRASAFRPGAGEVRSIVYTTFTPLGHIYEVTGAGPHDIPISISSHGRTFKVVVHHPGVLKRPHFVPGLLAAANDSGTAMRGKMLASHGGR